MDSLVHVNRCGDDFMKIPESYLPELVTANNWVIFCIAAATAQALCALAVGLTCLCAPKPKHHQYSETELRTETRE